MNFFKKFHDLNAKLNRELKILENVEEYSSNNESIYFFRNIDIKIKTIQDEASNLIDSLKQCNDKSVAKLNEQIRLFETIESKLAEMNIDLIKNKSSALNQDETNIKDDTNDKALIDNASQSSKLLFPSFENFGIDIATMIKQTQISTTKIPKKQIVDVTNTIETNDEKLETKNSVTLYPNISANFSANILNKMQPPQFPTLKSNILEKYNHIEEDMNFMSSVKKKNNTKDFKNVDVPRFDSLMPTDPMKLEAGQDLESNGKAHNGTIPALPALSDGANYLGLKNSAIDSKSLDKDCPSFPVLSEAFHGFISGDYNVSTVDNSFKHPVNRPFSNVEKKLEGKDNLNALAKNNLGSLNLTYDIEGYDRGLEVEMSGSKIKNTDDRLTLSKINQLFNSNSILEYSHLMDSTSISSNFNDTIFSMKPVHVVRVKPLTKSAENIRALLDASQHQPVNHSESSLSQFRSSSTNVFKKPSDESLINSSLFIPNCAAVDSSLYVVNKENISSIEGDRSHKKYLRDVTLEEYEKFGGKLCENDITLKAVNRVVKIVNKKIEEKKEKSTDCDSALIPLLCVHG